MNTIHLTAIDLGVASVLVLLQAVASFVLRLDLHRQVVWSALRMVVQLLLVGLVLRLVFGTASPIGTTVVIVLMIAAAVREVATRPAQRLASGGNFRIGAVVVSLASLATVALALLTAIRPEPWYDPRYAISLMGIVLGSVLNSASIGLDNFLGGVMSQRATIEARLALGATMREATSPLVRTSIRRGLIPIINQMSAAGLITLPGIMTGQIIAGMDPLEAVKYQILLLFLLTGASGIASAGAVYLAARAVSDARQRLRTDHLR